MLKIEELRKLDVKELKKEAHKAKLAYFEKKFKVALGTDTDVDQVKKLKSYVAQINTVKHEKEMAEALTNAA